MRALSWNCQGLRNPRTVNALQEIKQRWDPDIVFLRETKLHKKNIRRAKEKTGFVFGFMVPKSENCSGMVMLWKKETKLEIMGYAGNFIDAIVTNETSNRELLAFMVILKRRGGRSHRTNSKH